MCGSVLWFRAWQKAFAIRRAEGVRGSIMLFAGMNHIDTSDGCSTSGYVTVIGGYSRNVRLLRRLVHGLVLGDLAMRLL